jgi:3-oxoacid CoA-transferase subunit B
MAFDKNQIAKRIAKELKHNYYVNLGNRIPTLVANYIPEGIEFRKKTAFLEWSIPFEGDEDADLINAGKQTITTCRSKSSILHSVLEMDNMLT